MATYANDDGGNNSPEYGCDAQPNAPGCTNYGDVELSGDNGDAVGGAANAAIGVTELTPFAGLYNLLGITDYARNTLNDTLDVDPTTDKYFAGEALFALITFFAGGGAAGGTKTVANGVSKLTRPGAATKATANAVGLEREERVAEIVGGAVAKGADGQDIQLVVPGLGRTGLDVLGANGEYVFVGGPAKASNPARFGRALQIAKGAADRDGARAMYYLEEGTPQSAIDQATKWFGVDNVFVFPRGN